MDHGITTRRTGAEDVELCRGSKVNQRSRTRSQSRRRRATPQQLIHVQQGRRRAAARHRLVVARRRLVQVLQVQHLQGIHTCREEASQVGLLGPRVATG